jgi:hypothetical protein
MTDTHTNSHVLQTKDAQGHPRLSSAYLLQQFVEDAYYLHTYSVTSGKTIPENISKTIIEFKKIYERGEADTSDPDVEVRFSAAYRELAALMYPVTVESLRDTEDVQFDAKGSLFKRFWFSKAQQVAFSLLLVTILLFLLIVTCEIIQAIFIPGLRDIMAKEDKIGQIRTGVTDNPAVLDQIDDLDRDIRAILKNLKATWENLPFLPVLFKTTDLGEKWADDPDKTILIKTRATIIIEVFNRLLPILYGALGATAYMLRVLIPYIRNRTFNQKYVGSISIRVCLGMISGIAIQWFFVSGQQSQIFERSLSTSVLAFLAGYNVDLLFTVMDRFVQGFKPQKTSTTAE